jgi:cell division transport system ATP-binding protein
MEFKHVSISYKQKTVLRDINLSIEPGEFVFLIWASGSGKTTFIRSILGILHPKQWKILTDTQVSTISLSPKELLRYRRSIGVIFQDFKLLPRKTVYENVAFAMEVCWYDRETILARSTEILAQVWLLEKKHRFIETLSWWEIQRTCIARALIHHPNTIICDEPTGNLDRKNATEVMHLLENLHRAGKTIIMATHDETIVNTLKKRVIAFRDGKILSDEKPGSYCL